MDDRIAVIQRILDCSGSLFHKFNPARDRAWLNVDLTMPQVKALICVSKSNGATSGEIARNLGVGLSTITGIVDRLAEQDLSHAVRIHSIAASRACCPPNSGNRLVDDLLRYRSEIISDILAQLDERAAHGCRTGLWVSDSRRRGAGRIAHSSRRSRHDTDELRQTGCRARRLADGWWRCGSAWRDRRFEHVPAPPALTVPAATAQRGEIQQTLSLSGDVRAREQITVLPKASGRVERCWSTSARRSTRVTSWSSCEQDSQRSRCCRRARISPLPRPSSPRSRPAPKSDDIAAAQEALAQQQSRLDAMQAQGRTEDVAAARRRRLSAQSAKLNRCITAAGPEAVARPRPRSTPRSKSWRWCRRARPTTCGRPRPAPSPPMPRRSPPPKPHTPRSAARSAADLQNLRGAGRCVAAQVQAAQSAINARRRRADNQKRSSAADIQAAQTALDQAQASLTRRKPT